MIGNLSYSRTMIGNYIHLQQLIDKYNYYFFK